MLNRKRRNWRWLLAIVVAAVCPAMSRAVAADAAEQNAYDAALRAFVAGSHARAAGEFGEFTNRFPNSTLRAGAVRRALFARGEADLERGDNAGAAAVFAAFQAAFPEGELSADAALREAGAWLAAGDPARAAATLDRADGPFRRAMAAKEPRAVLFSGLLLGAEAKLALKDPAAARKSAQESAVFARTPVENWRRIRMELRAVELLGDREAAVATAAELRRLADEPTLANQRPESSALLGRLLFDAGQPGQATTALEENLAPGVPAPWRLEAIERLSDWWIRGGELARAREQLERAIAGTALETEAAPVRIRLAQVLLRQFQGLRGTNTPGPEGLALLTSASAQLDRAATNALPDALAGPWNLARAWCWWEEGVASGSRAALTNALAGFSNAVTRLPANADRVVAQFKAADTAAALGDSATALAGYLAVADSDVADPVVREELIPAALEQSVVNALVATNATAGEKSLRRLLALPNAAVVAGRSALLLGGTLARRGAGDAGRGLLQEFLGRFTNSPVRPEVELELAAISLHEERWTNAVADLRRWIGTYTNHPSGVRAGFHLAYALARSGDPTAAMDQFSRLAAAHPEDPEALTAQLWLAGNFFERQDFLRAGQACAAILTNANARVGTSGTWHRAKLWAAEAGRKLQNYDSAADQFRELLNDKSTPPDLQAAAYFHYGEMLLEKPPAPGAEPLAGFRLALEAFSRVPEFTNSPYATPALGMMANCHFQLGTLNPANYDRAAELYRRATSAPGAGIVTRSQAQLGLAEVLRKQAELRSGAESTELLDRAIRVYEDIAYGRVLEPGETLPPTTLAEASRLGGEVLERLGRTRQAAGLYENAARELPSAAAPWNERARRLREAIAERPR
jgi:TolA-binding protein